MGLSSLCSTCSPVFAKVFSRHTPLFLDIPVTCCNRMKMAARYLVCLVLFKYLLLCDSAPDQCVGMGKAMRKLKCGETVQKEEKIYQETTKHFESKYKGKMVQEHYVDLPYPPFSFSDMAREMSYYAGNVRGHPLFQQYANSLDMLNHYLYKVRKWNMAG